LRLPINKIICSDCVEAMSCWPDGCVDMVVTSIPYWGLRSYWWGGDLKLPHKKHNKNGKPIHDWADQDEIYQICTDCGALRPRYGIEPTLEEYIATTVEIFREVRKVLKDWGTLWLNVGDAYATSSTSGEQGVTGDRANRSFTAEGIPAKIPSGLKPGDLIGLPWRVAFALQKDGWYLRSAIIWCKSWSFHDCGKKQIKKIRTDLWGRKRTKIIDEGNSYVGSCMPESLKDWWWERCRVKVKSGWGDIPHPSQTPGGYSRAPNSGGVLKAQAQWQDCPGCDKCRANGGYVLRKGSWRPTSAYEMLFEFSKSKTYYCDAEAVREELVTSPDKLRLRVEAAKKVEGRGDALSIEAWGPNTQSYNPSGRNLRNVWCIQTQATSVSHYATFPEKLVEPCVKAGTSEKGNCPKCGMPWARVIEINKGQKPRQKGEKYDGINAGYGTHPGVGRDDIISKTLGWRPTCTCNAGEPVPAVVYDPFAGTNTTGYVAKKLKRNWLATEINPKYIKYAKRRLQPHKKKGTLFDKKTSRKRKK